MFFGKWIIKAADHIITKSKRAREIIYKTNLYKINKARKLKRRRMEQGRMVIFEKTISQNVKLLKISRRLHREMSERKKLEEDLRSIRQAFLILKKAHQKVEEELVRSYRHAGLINRKFSVLLDLDRNHYWENKKDLTNHILDIASNLSQADAGYLYKEEAGKGFRLLNSKNVKKKEVKRIKFLEEDELVSCLVEEKAIMKGDCLDYGCKIFDMNKLKHFLAIPLVRKRDGRLKGFIILGFAKKKIIDAKDVEFYDVFAMHAAAALLNAGVLA